MTLSELDNVCLSLSGAEKDFKAEWGWTRYTLRGKMFAAFCHDKSRFGCELITLKCAPAEGEFLREQYPDKIMEGYYMDHRNWISVKTGSDVPNELIQELAVKAYRLILKKLPKKVQTEIGDNSVSGTT